MSSCNRTSYHTISTMEWSGKHPQRFRGSRSHKHVPANQLDFRLQSIRNTNTLPGRRHFSQKDSLGPAFNSGNQAQIKPHLRTYEERYDSKIFNFPIEKKLIKVDVKDKNSFFMRRDNRNVGVSKMKALQEGNRTTGIYRNFYKGQSHSINKKNIKSASMFPSRGFGQQVTL